MTQPEVEEIRALLTSKSFRIALHGFILREIMFILGTLKSSFVFSISVIGKALFHRAEEQRKIVKINVFKGDILPPKKTAVPYQQWVSLAATVHKLFWDMRWSPRSLQVTPRLISCSIDAYNMKMSIF